MKFHRPILILLAVALLISGCSSPQPTTTVTTTPVTTIPAPTATPGDGPAMDRAAAALDGWIPDGLRLVQTRKGDTLERSLVPEAGGGAWHQ